MAKASIIDDIINSRLFRNVFGDVKSTMPGVMDNRGIRFAAESLAGKKSAEEISAAISQTQAGWYNGLGKEGQDALEKRVASALSSSNLMDANGNVDLVKFRKKLEKGLGSDALNNIKDPDLDNWAQQALNAYNTEYGTVMGQGKQIFASNPEFDLNNLTGPRKGEALVRSYFSADAGKEVQRDRIGAAIGAYAIANTGGRLLTGGSLTRNSSGQRDIAGIPFI